MRAALVLAAVACVSAVGACPPSASGAGEGEGEGEEGDALPAASYCEELAPVFCPFYLRCGRMAVDSAAACESSFAASCEAAFEPRFTGLAAAGLLTLSRSGLDACAAHLDDAACDTQLLELSGPCAAIWRGNVDEGGACGLDAESFVCAPGTTCTLGLDFCGTCERVLDVGAPCRDGDEPLPGSCGPAGFCADDDVCVARPVVGDSCGDAVPCVLPARCSDGVCREPAVVGVGDACDRERRCPYRSRCENGVCVATGAVGDACADDGDCDVGACAPLSSGGGVCGEADVGEFPAACVDAG